jgi:hypothetical protein
MSACGTAEPAAGVPYSIPQREVTARCHKQEEQEQEQQEQQEEQEEQAAEEQEQQEKS